MQEPEDKIDADIRTFQMLVDFNGDGQLDVMRVWQPQPGQPVDWCIATEDPVPVYRMRELTQGSRATTTVDYGFPASEATILPFRFWGLSKIEQQDLGTQRVGTKEHLLYDPAYDFASREFRGYAKVRVTDKDHTTALRHVDHSFKQDEWGFGKPWLVETRDVDPEESVLKKVETTYDPPQIFSGDGGDRAWVRPANDKVTLYYAGSNTTETETAYHYFPEADYNKLGLLWKRENKGYTDVADDGRLDVYEYYVRNDTSRLIVRTKRETRLAGSSPWQLAARTEYLYDDMCDTPGSPMTDGKLCGKSVVRGSGLEPANYRYYYDVYGRLTREDFPDGENTTYTYWEYLPEQSLTPYVKTATNALGHVTSYSDYHPLSGQAGIVCGPQYVYDPGDKCDELSYDKYGRVTERRLALENGLGSYSPYTVETLTYADGAAPAYVQSVIDPDPVSHSPTLPTRTERAYYDIFGGVVLEAKQLGIGATWAKSYFAYDALGKLEKVWVAWEEATSGYQLPTASADYEYEHDLLDRLTKVKREGVDWKIADYELKNVQVTDGEQKVTTYAMSAHGEIETKTQNDGSQNIVHSFLYDGAGRLTMAMSPNSAQYHYLYLKDGSLSQTWFMALGGINNYDRTPGGKLERLTRSNGSEVSYWYDPVGRVCRRSMEHQGACPAEEGRREEDYYHDWTSRTIGLLNAVEAPDHFKAYSYDARNRVTDVVLEDLQMQQALSYAKQYTATGEVRKIEYPSGRILEFDYDAAGRPTSFTDHYRLSGNASYRPDGQPLETNVSFLLQPLTVARDYQYDTKQRLQHLNTMVNPGATSWNVEYGYYNNDNLENYKDPASTLDYHWSYDGANRLTSSTGYQGGNISYIYHKNGALNSAAEAGTSWSYTYASSNKVKLTQMASYAATHNFTHDAAGQRCTMTGSGLNRSYEWTADGNLAQMSDSSQSFTTEYSYDHAGERWRRTDDKETIWYLDDIVERSTESGVLEYYPLPGARCAFKENNQGKCYLKDQLSSVMMVAGTGAVMNKSTYYPYGKRLQLQGTQFSTFGFNDKREEKKGDLVYYGARYYDPFVRQFTSVDPLREVGAEDVLEGNSLQPYVYAAANPTTFTDNGGLRISVPRFFGKPGEPPSQADAWIATLSVATFGVGGVVVVAGEGAAAAGTAVVTAGAAALEVVDKLPLWAKIVIEIKLGRVINDLVFRSVPGNTTEGKSGQQDQGEGPSNKGQEKGPGQGKQVPPDPPAREKGMRWRAGDDAQQQLADVERAQRAYRKGKGNTRIDSTAKSKDRFNKYLRDIRKKDDVEK